MTRETNSETDAAGSPFGEVEAAFLADALEIEPALISARTREPLGDGSISGFDVDADGGILRYYVDTSRSAVVSETGLALGDPAAPEARVWLHPADPHLPALASAAFGHAAEVLLARLGIVADGLPAIAAYRPGRRAVLRVATADGAVWIKVVRPSRVERIVGLHRRLGAGGVPVPAVLGWAPEGLIVLEDARGIPAVDVEWDATTLLDSVDALRAELSAVRIVEPVHGAAARLPWYATRLSNGSSPIEKRGARLVDHLRAVSARIASVEATVHGDLHFGQLFLGPRDAIVSVIDVDTAGCGDPAEDDAAFLSHAIASALITSTDDGRARVWRLADLAYARWGGDPMTRLLTAVHLVGHMIGALDRGDLAMGGDLLGYAESIAEGGAVRFGTGSPDPKSRLTHVFERA